MPGSIAAMRLLARRTGRPAGGSTGNLRGAFAIIAGLRAPGVRGPVVTLLRDGDVLP